MNPAPSQTDDSLLEVLTEEMADRWQAGDRPLAEEFLDRHPELWLCSEIAIDLIAEELVLRVDFGCPTTADELTVRFPQWSDQVRSLLDCQRILGPQFITPKFPEPGERLGDFLLQSELGRGSHGRVYLALQPLLADRPIVLKVTPESGTEHLSLARLQHTHIVPLYSAHDFSARGLRGLCLPYFGGATLAAIQDKLTTTKGQSLTGLDLLTALKTLAPMVESTTTKPGPAWAFLTRASFEESVCWIGACLADALQYAHDHGMLHLDLKPSNVLIAADGIPMLLDFHLARSPLREGDTAPAGIGGTPGYMAPEQLLAFEAIRTGKAIPTVVDGRADLFALGLLLRQLLNCKGSTENAMRRSVGLDDILNKCVMQSASQRYRTAAELASDLRRQLGDLPLKGVGNRSWGERFRKWRKRRPYAFPLALALMALLAGLAGVALHVDRLADRAHDDFREGQALLNRGQFQDASVAFHRGEQLIEGIPFQKSLHSQFQSARQLALRGKAADDVHQFAEQIRPYFDPTLASSDQTRFIQKRCREIWDQRLALVDRLTGQPTAERERQWRLDLLDVAILLAMTEERFGVPNQLDAGYRSALTILQDAKSLLGESPALTREQIRLEQKIGLSPQSDPIPGEYPKQSSWDYLAIGRRYLSDAQWDAAIRELDRCLARDPQSLWAHSSKGICCLRLHRPIESVAEFSICITLAPDSAWCVYNRGLAYTEAKSFDAALADLNRSVELDPKFVQAYIARAAVHHDAGRFAQAIDELNFAATVGAEISATEYRKAVVYVAAGDRPKAIQCLLRCLESTPANDPAQKLLRKLTGN